MGISCQRNVYWPATNHLSVRGLVQPIKELSSVAWRCAGRGCALIRQLANRQMLDLRHIRVISGVPVGVTDDVTVEACSVILHIMLRLVLHIATACVVIQVMHIYTVPYVIKACPSNCG